MVLIVIARGFLCGRDQCRAAGRAKEILFNSRNDAREDGGVAIRKEGPPSCHVWGGESRITLETQTLGFAAPSWFEIAGFELAPHPRGRATHACSLLKAPSQMEPRGQKFVNPVHGQ
jgi:hypothetical protein